MKTPAGLSQLADIAAARAQAHVVLRDTFNELPAAARLCMLEGPLLQAAVTGDAAGKTALAVVQDAISGIANDSLRLTTIAVERTRLLRGIAPGYGLPPACESVYRPFAANGEDSELGQAWAVLLEQYGRAGFAPDRTLPPDFIGNELGFLVHLARCESADWRRGDAAAALAHANEQLAFLDHHALRWIGTLLNRIRCEASTGFWPAVLALTESHLRHERNYLRQLLQRGADDPHQCHSGTIPDRELVTHG